jgi:hypothetical protein
MVNVKVGVRRRSLSQRDALTIDILHHHQGKVVIVAVDPNEGAISWSQCFSKAPSRKNNERLQECHIQRGFDGLESETRKV